MEGGHPQHATQTCLDWAGGSERGVPYCRIGQPGHMPWRRRSVKATMATYAPSAEEARQWTRKAVRSCRLSETYPHVDEPHPWHGAYRVAQSAGAFPLSRPAAPAGQALPLREKPAWLFFRSCRILVGSACNIYHGGIKVLVLQPAERPIGCHNGNLHRPPHRLAVGEKTSPL